MRGLVVRSFGGPEVLEVADLPEPPVGAGQVLVRVAAAPVTPVDIDIRSGGLASVLSPRPYYALGRTAAGQIDHIGDGVAGYRIGDAVIGVCGPLSAGHAAQAEQVVFEVGSIARAPRNVSLAESSALPLNGLTADQALDGLRLGAAATVLVTGAAGSVGALTVQLAKARGWQVIATARSADEELVRGLRADHFIPSTDDVAAAVRRHVPSGVDGLVDAAVLGAAVAPAVRDGGSFVTLVIGGEPPAERGISVSTVWARPDAARLAQLVDMVEEGALVPRPAEQYPLSRAADAHRRVGAGGVRTQVVLVP